MPEVKLTHVIGVVAVVGAIGFVALAFGGYVAVGWFNKKNLQGALTTTTATARGFTPAKTPEEAMTKFREAIERREYKYAAIYCTKPYADILDKSHENAHALATVIDKLRNWGEEKTLLTDKLILAFYQLDPFPTNFTVKGTTKEVAGKATGEFRWETPSPTTRNPNPTFAAELKEMDPRMFTNILAYGMFSKALVLVKEEEAWKIDVPVNPLWNAEVIHFNESAKRYTNRLTAFWGDLGRERYAGESHGYQTDIFQKFKDAK